MKLVMTMMVRDEVDVVEAMIRFHLAQGVDTIIVTDNGSVDGTAEVLERLRGEGLVELRHDPVQRKQQGETVTSMARDAYTVFGADWVLNADADEFWTAVDPHQTLRDAFAGISKEIQSFTIPVIDMTGNPAMTGSGLQRLSYRDLRSDEQLKTVGLLAHSTHDSAHIGDADVVVSQGNHFVSVPSHGEPDMAHRIEVRHFPWRSWQQFSRKVDSAGRAYDGQSALKPSPNHHGMRDYRRLQEGTLFAFYVLRHPSEEDIARGLARGEFVHDTRIADTVPSPVVDTEIDPSLAASQRRLAKTVEAQEKALAEAAAHRDEQDAELANLRRELATTTSDLAQSELRAESLLTELTAERARKIVRLVNRVVETSRRLTRRP